MSFSLVLSLFDYSRVAAALYLHSAAIESICEGVRIRDSLRSRSNLTFLYYHLGNIHVFHR